MEYSGQIQSPATAQVMNTYFFIHLSWDVSLCCSRIAEKSDFCEKLLFLLRDYEKEILFSSIGVDEPRECLVCIQLLCVWIHQQIVIKWRFNSHYEATEMRLLTLQHVMDLYPINGLEFQHYLKTPARDAVNGSPPDRYFPSFPDNRSSIQSSITEHWSFFGRRPSMTDS